MENNKSRLTDVVALPEANANTVTGHGHSYSCGNCKFLGHLNQKKYVPEVECLCYYKRRELFGSSSQNRRLYMHYLGFRP